MKIIHTSDWHLGQNFMGKSREKEHQAFLNWLLVTIDRVKADVLVVAGDIFDTGTPPSYARAMYNNFIVSLGKTRCKKAVFVGGNHDSPATLNEAKEVLACLNTFVCGKIMERPRDHVLVLEDDHGQPGAILCAVPFIRPRDLVLSCAGQSGQDKQNALADNIADFYDQVFEAAHEVREKTKLEIPILATGHLTIVGGKATESVRDIYIGSLDAFPGARFPGFDYIALGHLHRGQQIKGADHIRYSGSPIPLSFDEGKKEKQLLLVDVEGKTIKSVQPVFIPCFRKIATIKGDLVQIEQQISGLPDPDIQPDHNYDPDLFTAPQPVAVPAPEADPGSDPEQVRNMWLEVEVSADDYIDDLQARIQAMIEDRPIELLRIRRKRKPGDTGLGAESNEKLEELSVEEVFLRRLNLEDHDDQTRSQMLELFKKICSSLEQGEMS